MCQTNATAITCSNYEHFATENISLAVRADFELKELYIEATLRMRVLQPTEILVLDTSCLSIKEVGVNTSLAPGMPLYAAPLVWASYGTDPSAHADATPDTLSAASAASITCTSAGLLSPRIATCECPSHRTS